MTGEQLYEQRLADWLEDGPMGSPDRAVQSAVVFARAHPRGPSLLGSLRATGTAHLPRTALPLPPHWARVAAFATIATITVVALAVIGGGALLLNQGPANQPAAAGAMSMPPVSGVGDGQTVNVTVSGVSGRAGDDLAVVLYAGGALTDLERDVLGGFWSVVSGDEFTTTEVVRKPGDLGVGRFPFVSDEALTVAPGRYTLVVWVDDALNPASRWVPVNTDGRGLFGCQASFDVGDDAETDVVVTANLQPDGWNVDCATGVAIPGTDAAAAVAPDDGWWSGPWTPDLEASMPPVSGVGDGQTVNVTVSGVSGRAGDDLAVVLYAGGALTDLERDVLGGFWSVVSGDEFTTTEVVRKPGDLGVGRFPFVSDEALTVAPGRYTLVVWVDDALNPASRWVPVNTDGRGLFGCQASFDVGDDAETDVVVTANLQPDGWNVDCATP